MDDVDDDGDDEDEGDDDTTNEIERPTRRLKNETNIRKSLETHVKWNPAKPFYVPKRTRKFRPDWSFHEHEHEREEYLEKHPRERVSFESELGQTRFALAMKTVGDDLLKMNYELVELVVTSLLRCTNCDVAKSLFRAQEYFDFYVDVFGDMSYKQTLKNDDELRETIETGCIQVIENVDREGRAMLWALQSRLNHGDNKKSPLRVLKMANYVILRTLRNYPMCQQNGLIICSDMGALKFENFVLSSSRTNLICISKFMPVKIHRMGVLRPLLFIRFMMPACRSFVFPGRMAQRVHILTQDPRDLLREPFLLRKEILPPSLGGNNVSHNFLNRIHAWRLEEEEHENEGSCGSRNHMYNEAADELDTAQNNNRGQTREFAEDPIYLFQSIRLRQNIETQAEEEEKEKEDTEMSDNVSVSYMSYHTANN